MTGYSDLFWNSALKSFGSCDERLLKLASFQKSNGFLRWQVDLIHFFGILTSKSGVRSTGFLSCFCFPKVSCIRAMAGWFGICFGITSPFQSGKVRYLVDLVFLRIVSLKVWWIMPW